MRTQVKSLYEISKNRFQLSLIAGQSGMRNSASWIYLTEDIQNISFVKGGELVITTGLFIQSGVTLWEFIRTFALRGCSGILLNIGRYLQSSDITEEMIAFCNSHRFPLFTMPWEIHLADVMQEFCNLFLSETLKEDRLSAAFQSAVYQSPFPENSLSTLHQFGFPENAEYRVIAIGKLAEPTRIASLLNRFRLKYHLFQQDASYLLIYIDDQKTMSLDVLLETIQNSSPAILGVGDIAHSLSTLCNSYQRANFALTVAEQRQIPSLRFDQMGIFQLLSCISDLELLHAMYQERLGVIEQYDTVHHSDYLNTLRVFLLSNGSLQETAARMYTHRNTVIYRIRKMKELLQCELDTASTKFDFMLLFSIKDFLDLVRQD